MRRRYPCVLLALLCAACSTTHSNRDVRSDPCVGGALQLDDALRRCIVPDLVKPERIVTSETLVLEVSLRPPAQRGGDILVGTRVINVSESEVEVDLVSHAGKVHPAAPTLLDTDGLPVAHDMDPTCVDMPASARGSLGARSGKESAIARVRLTPGGSISAERTVPARYGLCICAPDSEGVLDLRCTEGEGEPVAAGAYAVGVGMPAAIERRDGKGPYTFPYATTPLALANDDPWPN